MTPKEKADELFRKMYQVRSVAASDITKHFAKQSALIAVDEIIKEYGTYFKVEVEGKYVSYWQQVKQEIEKL
jgi:hypothetical protein